MTALEKEIMAKFGNNLTLLEKDMWDDFRLFYENKEEYKKKVDDMSKLFGVTENPEFRFKNDYLPTYIVGNYKDKKEKYVVISLNPGFKEELSKREEEIKKGSVDNYHKFILEFFTLISKIESEIKLENKNSDYSYYNCLRPYLSKLINEEIPKDKQFDVFFEYLINIDIIPYPSHEFKKTPKKQTST